MNGHQNTKMSAQSKELSPISMLTEQLSNLHLSENSGFINSVRSFDVKNLFFGKNTFLSLESGEDQRIDKPEIKSPEADSKTFFYAVNIPKKSDLSNDGEDESKDNDVPLVFDNKGDALKLLKLHKNARYKSFTSKEEAEKFSLQSAASETVETPNPSLSPFEDEDGLPSVKCQDLVILRKAIEQGSAQSFSQLVWENARYLVNYHGDTPSILHEGFRYNDELECRLRRQTNRRSSQSARKQIPMVTYQKVVDLIIQSYKENVGRNNHVYTRKMGSKTIILDVRMQVAVRTAARSLKVATAASEGEPGTSCGLEKSTFQGFSFEKVVSRSKNSEILVIYNLAE
ncbi:uncharacterized protein [Parasteatoda tepidariorum]|uniref:uncharacterized protein n=1 Tax=Parasteatoda tepidariorum TaxID=114398 RepID=UPI0039BD54C4